MGLAIVLSLLLIILMIGMIVVRGFATFWPRPIDEVRLADGSVFLGVPMGEEAYEPSETERTQMESARDRVVASGIDAWNDEGMPLRRRYLVGNRDLGQQTFRWVPLWQVESLSRPVQAVLVERREWGVFLGRIEAVVRDDVLRFDVASYPNPTELLATTQATVDGVTSDVQRTLLFRDNEAVMIRQRAVLTDPELLSLQAIDRALNDTESRLKRIADINERRVPGLQNRIRSLEWKARQAAIDHRRSVEPERATLGVGLWIVVLALAGGGGFALVMARRRIPNVTLSMRQTIVFRTGWTCVVVLAAVCWLERPWARPAVSAERLAQIEQDVQQQIAQIREQQRSSMAELEVLRREDARYRVLLREPLGGRISAVSQSEPDEPMLMSQIVRIVPGNDLSWLERMGVYGSRWAEFLFDKPRDGTASGGVFPVIVGTVTLTLLLTVCVVPLGVIAALYLREYARQGVLTSIIRIAVNNLAGVPSIVYGMFGLGFFCYTLGEYVDGGPATPLPTFSWWVVAAVCAVIVILAGALGMMGKRVPGASPTTAARVAAMVSIVCWCAAVGLAFWLAASTPYFTGFFEEKLPETPTFGGRGILWASLTLALLTLPVVIVATEEAIAAVPGSMREGSFGCGASKWQTIWHIVLPSAMPGILTGAILAMARGAGEVAPLMLVGAVNLAPALPVSAEAPFLHGDRTFMHLGFHIYTLGFQSPDSEATEPLVWTTTLLLLMIVLLLNLVAIVIRARLRARMRSASV